MIKNRELALIPDSALQLLDVPATAPEPRSPTARTSTSTARPDRRWPRGMLVSRRTPRRTERSAPP